MKSSKKPVLKDGAPIKYALGMHSVLPSYPTANDFIFDCVNHHAIVTKKSDLNFESIPISKADLRTIYSEKLKDSTFVSKLKETIKTLVDLGKVTKRDDDLLIMHGPALEELYVIA